MNGRLKKEIISFRNALKGVVSHARSESHFRFHLWSTLMVVFFGFLLHVSKLEWCLLILCIILVLAAESFNTAIEKMMDIIHPGEHSQVGFIKDVTAAAVLIVSVGAAIIGSIIFFPKLLALILTG